MTLEHQPGDLVRIVLSTRRELYGMVREANGASVLVEWETGEVGRLFYERSALANAYNLQHVGKNERFT